MTIKSGYYTIQEVLDIAKFDFESKAAADHLDGAPDYRRVKVGGLGFDSLDKQISIPDTAASVDITLDDQIVSTLPVEIGE